MNVIIYILSLIATPHSVAAAAFPSKQITYPLLPSAGLVYWDENILGRGLILPSQANLRPNMYQILHHPLLCQVHSPLCRS